VTPALHHVALGTQRVDELAAFYRDVVGLPELRRHLSDNAELRSVWLDMGGCILMIERTSQPAREVNGIGSGPFLLAFRVSVEQRQQVEERLFALGIVIESRSEFTSYARDSDGNRIAFSSYVLA
jgi:catechol 2,3-dioxygenase-like lactoylglutathione lyase family enzyme